MMFHPGGEKFFFVKAHEERLLLTNQSSVALLTYDGNLESIQDGSVVVKSEVIGQIKDKFESKCDGIRKVAKERDDL